MFLLKYFKDFLVIQCTDLLCAHYKVDLYYTMHGVKCSKVVDFPKSDHIYTQLLNRDN